MTLSLGKTEFCTNNDFHLVYVNVTRVIWHDLVLQTNLQIISPVFQYIRGNLMLVIVNLAILTLYLN